MQGVRYTTAWDAFKGGTELSADFILDKNEFKYSGGLNARTVQWGTQADLALGALKKVGENLEVGAELQNGVALFRSKKLYVTGGELKVNYLILRREKATTGLTLGARYTSCPGYKAYSLIYDVVEIPVGIFIRF